MSAALSDWTRSAARRHAPRATVALSPSRAALVEQAAPAAAFAAAIAQGALAGEPSRPHWAGAYVYLFTAEGRHVFRHAATGTETSCAGEAAH